jgi:divinyl protochlorophyllide a 8-vinyl-reductase
MTDNPLRAGERAAAPVCAWHAAVFECLFRALASPRVQATETACEAAGDGCRRFVVSLGA